MVSILSLILKDSSCDVALLRSEYFEVIENQILVEPFHNSHIHLCHDYDFLSDRNKLCNYWNQSIYSIWVFSQLVSSFDVILRFSLYTYMVLHIIVIIFYSLNLHFLRTKLKSDYIEVYRDIKCNVRLFCFIGRFTHSSWSWFSEW